MSEYNVMGIHREVNCFIIEAVMVCTIKLYV